MAVVEGEPISPAEVKREAEAAHVSARAALDALIEAKLLAHEAERRGLATDRQVLDAVERELVRRYLQVGFEHDVTADNTVTKQDVQHLFDKNRARFDHPELRHVVHILAAAKPTDPATKREAARQRIEEVAKQAKSATDKAAFEALVAKLSDGDVKLRTEEFATPRQGLMVEPFAAAAFALQKPGEVSGVVETDFGYHVIFLVETLPEIHDTAETAHDKLVEALWPKLREREFGRRLDALVDKHHIETWPDRIEPNAGEGAPPSSPTTTLPTERLR